MRSPASWRRLALLVLVAFGTGGCSSYLIEEGDPTAPILVRGRVVDANGGGVSGATVRLQADTDMDTAAGELTSFVELGSYRAGLDGFFVVRLAPTAALEALADQNGGAVIFTLVAFEGLSVPFAFSRALGDGGWLGEVPDVEFSPSGVTGGGRTQAPTALPLGA